MLNVFQPDIGSLELAQVGEVFKSNWVGKGKITDRFEAAFAEHLGAPVEHVLSVVNCTQGLINSMKLLSISPGDQIILPSISFVGAANAVVAAGATPVFCDVDRNTLNANLRHIEPLVTDETRAVILLHYGGVPMYDLNKIASFCKDNGIYLIEDAACSVSSRFNGRACGTFGDIGVWSFDAMKILCTVEGGMMYIANLELIERAKHLMFLGVSSESGITSPSFRWWEFDVNEAVGRYTMNDVFSAVGLVQLERLPGFIAKRKMLTSMYDGLLTRHDWIAKPHTCLADCESSYYFYWIQVERRDELAHFLRRRNIYTTFRYYPLHKVPFYGSDAVLPGAEYAAEHTLCLPLHQGMNSNDVLKVCDAIGEFKI